MQRVAGGIKERERKVGSKEVKRKEGRVTEAERHQGAERRGGGSYNLTVQTLGMTDCWGRGVIKVPLSNMNIR